MKGRGELFSNVDGEKMLILLVVALVVVGPERLPSAVMWVTALVRQLREAARDAADSMREDLGDEVEQFRAPFAELHRLSATTPTALTTDYLDQHDHDRDVARSGGCDAGGGPVREVGRTRFDSDAT